MLRLLSPRLENNLWKVKAIRFLSWMHLFAAVLVPFFRDWGGLDYTRIMLLNAWFMFCSFVLEVPTGTVADVFGRRTSLVLGFLLASAALLIYGSYPSFALFLAAEVVFALSFTLVSGADDALVYDTLVELDRAGEAKRTYARIESFKLGGMVAGALVGAPVAGWLGLRAPMLLSAIPFVAAAALAWTLVEPGAEKRGARGRLADTLFAGLRYFRGHRELRVLVFDMVATGSLAWLIIWFYQPQLERAGVPIAYFGAVHALLCIAQIAVLQNVERLEAALGSKRRYLFFSALAPGFAYLALGLDGRLVPSLVAILVAGGFGLTRLPLFIGYMNRFIPTEQRATVLSVASMLRTLAVAIVNPIAGWLADWSLPSALLIFGAAALGCALLSRVREEHLEPVPAVAAAD